MINTICHMETVAAGATILSPDTEMMANTTEIIPHVQDRGSLAPRVTSALWMTMEGKLISAEE